MKVIHYSNALKKEEIIYDDIINGHHVVILSNGLYPSAFVSVSHNNINGYYDIKCHGGITYFGKPFWNSTNNKETYLGWDYCHYGDYTLAGVYLPQFSKKWSTSEILNECKKVVEKLKNK